MWVSKKENLKKLSSLLLQAQKGIRLLDSLRWPVEIIEQVRTSKYKELPKVDASFYQSKGLEFDSVQFKSTFRQLITSLEAELPRGDSLAQIMIQSCEQYLIAIEMLENRGTKRFYELSKKLYGSPKDTFLGSTATVKDLSFHLYDILSPLDDSSLGEVHSRQLKAEQAAKILNKRFANYFSENVTASVDKKLIADAIASSKAIKLRQSAKFSIRDIDILEVHEGWVHIGTSINGSSQKILNFLGKGSPRATATQEGLAILMEIFSFVTLPRRARKINDRVLAIDKAEDGADFLDIVEYFRTEGYDELDCLHSAQRVFRGGDVKGGAPFTKDQVYCKGFVEVYNFIRACIQSGRPEMLPFLFVGKVSITDVPVLYNRYKEGIVDAPRYLPHFFRDLNSLVVWMSFSNFLHAADMAGAQHEYRNIIVNS